ncbi:MAG: hypothetical protein IKF38_00110 [Clostridia bacterium]|nr:hypothetical protein [Clostridia bacterium]
MSIPKIIRLGSNISTGLVLKIMLPTSPGETEHALHILWNGSIKEHFHNDEDGISEGYRVLNLETCEFSDWEVVGAGMNEKAHEIPYAEGLRIVEGSKRGFGIKCWPEITE